MEKLKLIQTLKFKGINICALSYSNQDLLNNNNWLLLLFNRRPLDTSDCPVCCEEFEPDKADEIVYCRTCGNNIHMVK